MRDSAELPKRNAEGGQETVQRVITRISQTGSKIARQEGRRNPENQSKPIIRKATVQKDAGKLGVKIKGCLGISLFV